MIVKKPVCSCWNWLESLLQLATKRKINEKEKVVIRAAK